MNLSTPAARRSLAALAAAVTLAAATLAAAQPKPAPPAPPADLRMLEAQSLLADRKPGEICKHAEAELRELLKNPDAPDVNLLARLSALRDFGAVLSRLQRLEGPEKAAASWLLGNETLLTTLMSAMTDADAPDAVLRIVALIHQRQGEKPAEFPDLATALAVVYDSGADMTSEEARAPDPNKAARLFAYYTNARSQMRFDPQTLPWQLQVFVVDNNITEPELLWALGKYSSRPLVKDAWYDVRYDEYPRYNPPAESAGPSSDGRLPRAVPAPRVGKGEAQSGTGNGAGRVPQDTGEYTDPTLEQLARAGGTTAAQSHYAVSVCRALGIPAAELAGQVETGAIRSWVGAMENGHDGHWSWDLAVGRPFEDKNKHWPAVGTDPQTHEKISDEELLLLTDLQDTPAKSRTASAALVRLAEKENWAKVKNPEDEITPAQRFKLLLRAVDLSPGNREAWRQIRLMGKNSELTAQDVDRVLAALNKNIAAKYPGIVLDVLTDVISWRGTREQLDMLDKARSLFSTRPDLQYKLLVRKGDLNADAKQDREALACWGAVLDRATDAGPIAVEAMAKVDALLRARNERQLLLNTYKAVWNRMPMPLARGDVRATAWYIIGSEYASALDEAGQPTDAENTRNRLRAQLNSGYYWRTWR